MAEGEAMQIVAGNKTSSAAVAPVASSADRVTRIRLTSPTIADVWRDAFATFGARAPGILLLALVGFAGAPLLGLGASLALNLEDYVHASGPFATRDGINGMLDPGDMRLLFVLVIQGLLGGFLASFARGVITVLALNTPDANFGQACRRALARMRALLIGTVIYGAVIGFGAVSVNVWLRNANLDLSIAGDRPATAEGALRAVLIRGMDALIPNPGAPVAELVPYWRHTAFTDLDNVSEYNQYLAIAYNSRDLYSSIMHVTPDPSELPRLTLVSLLILLIGETILRFRVVAAMQPTGAAGTVVPLLRGMWLGIRYFIPITIHVWFLRLAVALFSIAFIILPVVLVQCIAEPLPAWTGGSTTVVSLPLVVLVLSVMNGVFVAFGTVYDARLYVALTQQTQRIGNVPDPIRTTFVD